MKGFSFTMKIIVAVVSGLFVLAMFTVGFPFFILKLGEYLNFLYDGGIIGCYFVAYMLITVGLVLGGLTILIVGNCSLGLGRGERE